MANSSIAIDGGNVDVEIEAGGDARQVMVIGDKTTTAAIAPVTALGGLKVDLGADNDVTVTGKVSDVAGAADGTATKHIRSSAGTNITLVKAGACRVYSVDGGSAADYRTYLQLYDVSSPPTVGTTAVARSVMFQAGEPRFLKLKGQQFAAGCYCAMVKDDDSSQEIDTDAARTTAILAGDLMVDIETSA